MASAPSAFPPSAPASMATRSRKRHESHLTPSLRISRIRIARCEKFCSSCLTKAPMPHMRASLPDVSHPAKLRPRLSVALVLTHSCVPRSHHVNAVILTDRHWRSQECEHGTQECVRHTLT